MRIFACLLTVAAAALPGVLAAAEPAKPPVIEQRQISNGEREEIDRLFVALKRERDADRASGIANQIRAEIGRSGSATVDLLIQWADKAIAEKRNIAALDFLDQAIALKPDYTESWNRRATLNYALGNYRKSMSDIQRILSLEPRHFGALSGMAAILSDTGQDMLAMKAWQRYLEVYPADRTAQEQYDGLSEKLAGSRT